MSIVGEETSSPITQTIMSPLKNIPHKNGNEKSNSLWLTYADMSIWGYPRTYFGYYARDCWIRSNHMAYIRRQGPGGFLKEHFADGANALHVGGNVTWQRMKSDWEKNRDFEKFVRLQMPAPHIAEKQPTYWLFPKVD